MCAGNTEDYTSNTIPKSFFLIERVSELCCQSTGNSFVRITKYKKMYGWGYLCSHLCCLHTVIHISSLCGFWDCHPYIPIHFWRMFFILVAIDKNTTIHSLDSLAKVSTQAVSQYIYIVSKIVLLQARISELGIMNENVICLWFSGNSVVSINRSTLFWYYNCYTKWLVEYLS